MAAPQQRIGDFYAEVVLPALAAHLDAVFPEFGWKQDARGWVATNEEMTHRVLGVRADRVVAHGAAPPGLPRPRRGDDALDGISQRGRRSSRRDVPVRRPRARDPSRSRHVPDRPTAAPRPREASSCTTSSDSAGVSCTAQRARPHARTSSDAVFQPTRSISSISESSRVSSSRRMRSRQRATPRSRSRSLA